MQKTSILGKVAGFVLVIDPDNVRGKRERIEFSDLIELTKRASSACEGVPVSGSPRVTILTVYETHDGEKEEQEGYDFTCSIGVFATKNFCNGYVGDCNNSVGWTTARHRDRRGSLCGTCRQQELSDADVDVDGAYERHAREDEY